MEGRQSWLVLYLLQARQLRSCSTEAFKVMNQSKGSNADHDLLLQAKGRQLPTPPAAGELAMASLMLLLGSGFE